MKWGNIHGSNNNCVYYFFDISFTIGIGGFIYGIMEHKRIIDRARKIDPTVRTRSEAEYVLKKDIAQSLGEKNNKE